jgi:hypothetical protein
MTSQHTKEIRCCCSEDAEVVPNISRKVTDPTMLLNGALVVGRVDRIKSRQQRKGGL